MKSLPFLALLALLVTLAGCNRTEKPQTFAFELRGPDPMAPGYRVVPLSESALMARQPRQVAWLDEIVGRIAVEVAQEMGANIIPPESVYATVIDLRDAWDPRMGSYQGDKPVYPASVVKLCYMVTALDQVALKKISLTPELENDLRQMIEVSSNPATNTILDLVSNTSYGPVLDERARDSFHHKRQTVHRHMTELGLPGLWAAVKTYGEGTPFYGRDVEFLGQRAGINFENSNKMTSDDTARLLYLIWNRALVSPAASGYMLNRMAREEGRSRTFFNTHLTECARLYSKGGSTGNDRHDAGIISLPDGQGTIILSIFTRIGARGDRPIPRVLEKVAERVLAEVLAMPGSLDQVTGETAEEGLARLAGDSNVP